MIVTFRKCLNQKSCDYNLKQIIILSCERNALKTDDLKYINEFKKYRVQAWDLISEMLEFE